MASERRQQAAASHSGSIRVSYLVLCCVVLSYIMLLLQPLPSKDEVPRLYTSPPLPSLLRTSQNKLSEVRENVLLISTDPAHNLRFSTSFCYSFPALPCPASPLLALPCLLLFVLCCCLVLLSYLVLSCLVFFLSCDVLSCLSCKESEREREHNYLFLSAHAFVPATLSTRNLEKIPPL